MHFVSKIISSHHLRFLVLAALGTVLLSGTVSALTLTVKVPVALNAADADGAGTVVASAKATAAVTINLTSSNPAAVTVPATLLLPKGKSSVTLPYTIVDNLTVYGPQTTTITASAVGYVGGTVTVVVTDNKTTENWASFGNNQAHTGVYPGSLLGTYTLGWSTSFPSLFSALNPVTIARGTAYVTPITYFGISDLTAVNAATGAKVWQYVYSATASNSSNTTYFSINPPTVYKGNVYVQQGAGLNYTGSPSDAQVIPRLWSFKADSGKINWTVGFNAQFERYLAPMIYQDIGIWTDGGTGGGLYNFSFSGTQDHFVSEPQFDQWTPSYYQGTIYTWVGGTFSAVEPATGTVLWTLSETLPFTGYSMNCATPVAAGLAYLNCTNSLVAVNLTTRAQAWSVTMPVKGTPAVLGTRLYVISGSNVIVLNAKTGAKIATLITTDSTLTGQPVVANDAVVVSSGTATYLFDLKTNALAQTIPFGGPISAADGFLYLAGSDGMLRAYRSSTVNVSFTADGLGGLAAFGYTATGQSLTGALSFVPTPSTVLTAVNNTGPHAIKGTFSNLANGGTIVLSYLGIPYTFSANYAGGDGNDLTLKFKSAPPTAPTITNGPPPATTITTFPYKFAYTTAGFPVPTFSVTAGSLPTGLTLSKTGAITGATTKAGTFKGTITASNGVNPAATQKFSIVVAASKAPAITNGPPPAGAIHKAYSFAYTYKSNPSSVFALTSGSLPTGLTLSSDGVISGTPANAGTYAGTISARNGIGKDATVSFSILVEQAPAISGTPPDVAILANSTAKITFIAGGTPAPVFTLASGKLPPGMTLSSSGVLSGKPTAPGIYTGTVKATNAAGSTTQSFTITVQDKTTLNVNLAATLNLGDPDGQGTVTANSASAKSLTVLLSSSKPGVITVPASVVLPAGKTSVAFSYSIIDSLTVFGPQTTTIKASASGWTGASKVITVTDNKTTDNWATFGNGPARTGVYPGTLLGGAYSLAWSASIPLGTYTATGLNPVAIYKGLAYVDSYAYPDVSDLTVLNALTGAPVWTHVFNEASSINPPTVYKGNVYIQRSNNGGDTDLWKLNAATGAVVWSAAFGSQWDAYYAPLVFQSIGIWMDGGSYGGLYDFNFDGTQKAFLEEPQADEWTPSYYNGLVYSWVSDDVDGTFKAVSPATGAISWSITATAQNYTYSMHCGVPIDANLAFLNGGNALTAVNVITHAQVWSVAKAYTGTPAVKSGKLYVIYDSGVEIHDAGTGAILGTLDTGDSTGLLDQPVVSDDALVVASSHATYIFNLKTGTLAQTIPFGGPVTAAGGTLYIAGPDSILRAYHASAPAFSLSAKGVGVTSYGYVATGQTITATLAAAPTKGTVLKVIDNTSSSAIKGVFSNLADGATINVTYHGTAYVFAANYEGGDGNDLVLTYKP